jgi:hypothetical protein
MRFEVFMVVKIQVEVFWVVILYNVVLGYHSKGPCCTPEDGDSVDLLNAGILPQQHMGSQP